MSCPFSNVTSTPTLSSLTAFVPSEDCVMLPATGAFIAAFAIAVPNPVAIKKRRASISSGIDGR